MGGPLQRCDRGIWAGAVIVLALALAPSAAGQKASKADPRKSPAQISTLAASPSNRIEIVTFADLRQPPVKVVRGKGSAAGKPDQVEVVTFSDPKFNPVRVLRGGADTAPMPGSGVADRNIQTVSFADPRYQPVTVFRGPALGGLGFRAPDIDLFGPASTADLDRVAFAVDGVESSHGTDPGMWRAEPGGPQGPMQVSAAAASDLGGGDRFDLVQNRLLGRAYLARMFRRYGNWPDAIIAYNWGPGNVDWWIGGGRPADKLPLGVERYRNRVLHEIGLLHAPVALPPHPGRQIQASARR